jgi:ubiquinone biosynthesis protein Coq4
MKMTKTCKLVVEGGKFITGVTIGEMFFPFESVSDARETMVKTLDESVNSTYAIEKAAQKMLSETKSSNDTALNEIINILEKHGKLPVPTA